jgi:predicted DNA-binding antitoxin AbrB/MazE fold protein
MTKAARKSIEAIYEDGVFRPTRKVRLPERSRVRLTLVPLPEPDPRAARAQVLRQRRALLKLAGIGASGQTDISRNPEQALYGSPRA